MSLGVIDFPKKKKNEKFDKFLPQESKNWSNHKIKALILNLDIYISCLKAIRTVIESPKNCLLEIAACNLEGNLLEFLKYCYIQMGRKQREPLSISYLC